MLVGMIITHGKRASLLDLLGRLHVQTQPLDRLHLIVDDCMDAAAQARVDAIVAQSPWATDARLYLDHSSKYDCVGPGGRWLAVATMLADGRLVGTDIVLNFDDDVLPEPTYVATHALNLSELPCPSAVYWVWNASWPTRFLTPGISGGWTSYHALALVGFDVDRMRPWLDLRKQMTDDITISAWFHQQKVPNYILAGAQQFAVDFKSLDIALGGVVPNRWRDAQARLLLKEFGYRSYWLGAK